jgi:DNA processing protein
MARRATPDAALVLALASLPDIGPARIDALLGDNDPAGAWQVVLDGRAHEGSAAEVMGRDPLRLARTWSRFARSTDVDRLAEQHEAATVGVVWRGDADHPEILRADPHGPALLTWMGALDVLDGPRVAIVGTRDCTQAGRDTAMELGHELSEHGVRVVSGLALGIDAAAHAGAVRSGASPPIAVVGSGLDHIYPRRNAQLWQRVARDGVVLSEHPLGAAPVGWHFLARNRVIAALSDIVVVVESHERGGALQTATEAGYRGVPVFAVPGSVRSNASRGTNDLLRDGAQVCADVTDVLTALGLAVVPRERRETRPAPTAADRAVLDAIGWDPCSLEALLLRTGLGVGALALALDRLAADGWVVRRGAWTERVGAVSP